MVPWSRVELLTPEHDLGSFTCGDAEMDRWIASAARIEVSKGTTSVHVCVACDGDAEHICGFFALSNHQVRGVDLSRGLSKGLGTVPATLLGRLGRSIDHPGCGSHLVLEALRVATEGAKLVGSRLIVLDAKNQTLADWYREKNSFLPLANNPLRLVMKMATADAAVRAHFGSG